MKIIKDYQILIGLLAIALAIYLGLTTITKNDFIIPNWFEQMRNIELPKPKAGDPGAISGPEYRAQFRAKQRRYNERCPDGQEFDLRKYEKDGRNKVQMDDIKYCEEPKMPDV